MTGAGLVCHSKWWRIFGPHMALFSAHEIVRCLPLNMFRAFAQRAAAYRMTSIGSCSQIFRMLQRRDCAFMRWQAFDGCSRYHWGSCRPMALHDLYNELASCRIVFCLVRISIRWLLIIYTIRDTYKQSAKLNLTLNSAVFWTCSFAHEEPNSTISPSLQEPFSWAQCLVWPLGQRLSMQLGIASIALARPWFWGRQTQHCIVLQRSPLKLDRSFLHGTIWYNKKHAFIYAPL